ncbi:hypothetical protein HZA96_00290 [Candidatus Woesearchaeota archaeon]|nr:hypothetical protein [Candidatus Woesearchaeota archaeon]
MATKEWKAISVKVNEDVRNAIELICRREQITVSRFLANLVAHEVEPILNPNILPENKGIPLIGENKFKYTAESDCFLWQIDLGINGFALLGENIPPIYVENLQKAINDGLLQRTEFLNTNKKGAVIPPKLLKYKVKKHASTRT